MEKETKEIIKLTVKEILLTFIDIGENLFGWVDKPEAYRRVYGRHSEWDFVDRESLSKQIYKLRKQGLIRKVIESKQEYLELTGQGKEKVKKLLISNLQIPKPPKWDGRWRVIIFDVPDEKRERSNFICQNLKKLSFYRLQKSVYVYPFDCKQEINFISGCCFGRHYVKYLIADIIEGEEEIPDYFLEKGILNKEELKLLNKK